MPRTNIEHNQTMLGETRLLGNLGRTAELEVLNAPLNPGVSLLDVKLSDDSVGMPITLTFLDFDFLGSAGATSELFATIQYANGGMQSTVTQVSITRGKVITVYASYVRVSILAFGPAGGTRKVGAFATLGDSRGQPGPDFNNQNALGVAAAASVIFNISPFAHFFLVYSDQPSTIEIRLGAIVQQTIPLLAGERMGWFPLIGTSDNIRVTNTGVGAADITTYLTTEF